MATPVLMPKQGQSVETCNLLKWKKAVGDSVAQGEMLCEVETDKATFEVEAPAAGTLLATFFKEGDDVPVLTNIAVIGAAGEAVDSFRPEGAAAAAAPVAAAAPAAPVVPTAAPVATAPTAPVAAGTSSPVSPRARRLAAERGVAAEGLAGSGPHGRVIERDVQAALAAGQPLTPAAQAAAQATGGVAPAAGTGIGGRVTVADLQAKPSAPASAAPAAAPVAEEVTAVPVKGIRKLIAERMLASLTTTAQLTLNSSADASALLAYRSKLKHSPEELGLAKITVNDLLLFVVARTLATSPQVNAIYQGGTLYQHHRVHLAFAVDTPRGLMVPVIRDADRLSLKQLSAQAKRLASACGEGKINPDDLTGGTFTVTNLGSLGVESFTPVLNPPQVAILGVGNTQLKPVEAHGEVKFLPHLGLSLTIDHQVVDGAPGARFLQALAKNLAHLEVVLAL